MSEHKLITRAADRTVPIAVSRAAFTKLTEAAIRLGVSVGEIVERMIERAEQAELDPP